MNVFVVCTPIWQLPWNGYAGLEVIAYECAKGLAAKGHQVMLAAPDGSTCPGVQIVPTGPAGQVDEKGAFDKYWKHLLQADVVIDHSVAGDEKLLIRINGKCRWMSFEEVYGWAEAHFPLFLESGSVEIPVKGLEVPSVSNIHEVRWKEVSSVIRHVRKEPIYLIKARGGNNIHVTSGHSLMVAGRFGLTSVQANQSVGKFLATAKAIPCNEKAMKNWPIKKGALHKVLNKFRVEGVLIEQESRKEQKAEIENAGGVLTKRKLKKGVTKRLGLMARYLEKLPDEFEICVYRKKTVKWPLELTLENLSLFGLWIGDGCHGNSSVHISSGSGTRHVLDEVAKQFSSNCKGPSGKCKVRYSVHSHLLQRLMRAIGFIGFSDTKKIPDWVFDLNKEQIGAFLRGYFSADGSASCGVGLSSINLQLIEQTSVLLSMCGIDSSFSRWSQKSNDLSPDHKPLWHLDVSNDDLPLFLKQVGFLQVEKNEECKKFLLDRKCWRGDVPYSLIRIRKPRNGAPDYAISISRLVHERGQDVASLFENSDIRWRKIKSSEKTGREDEFVYDFSVPGTENFLVRKSCCHNSWQKFAYLLKQEGVLKAPVLGVLHAPVNTQIQDLPAGVDKPCFVCISDDQRAHFEGLFNRPARTCYNGVDPDVYKPTGAPRNGRYLFLARFSTIKGPDLAIEACKSAGVPLDLIGDTKITNEPELYKRCMDQADGKQIRVVGGVPRGETVWWYSQAHALAHANLRFREPFGLAPIESMCCGTPVLAFDNGAMRETVKNGVSGHLVKTLPEMVELIRSDAVAAIDRKACRDWGTQWSIQRMVNRYHDLCVEAKDGGW